MNNKYLTTTHVDLPKGHVVVSDTGAISFVEDSVSNNMKTANALKAQWRDLCNIYLEEFCKRHDYHYEPNWVANDPGTIAEIGDMFVSMDNIRYDVDNNIPVPDFEHWYWKSLEVYELTGEKYMNFPSYCKGAPDYWDDKKLENIRKGKAKIQAMTDELNKYVEELKADNKNKQF